MPRRKDISSTWKEGRYLDLWVFPHTMTGVTGGFANVFFGLSPLSVLGIGLVLMVLWEVAEVYAGITESRPNQVIDVLVGLVGVGIALGISSALGEPERIKAFWICLAVTAVSSAIGWINSSRKRRAARKKQPTG